MTNSPHRQKRPECLRMLAFQKPDFDLLNAMRNAGLH